MATLQGSLEIVLCLDRSRLTRLAESPIGRLLPLAAHRRPGNIRAVSRKPVFGRELYAIVSQAKIVLNGAVDMAGSDRGNMRCFEAMGCGALMVSDQGRYPEGMQNEKTMLLYEGSDGAMRTVKRALAEWDVSREIALNGQRLMRESYSKAKQWTDFVDLVEKL